MLFIAFLQYKTTEIMFRSLSSLDNGIHSDVWISHTDGTSHRLEYNSSDTEYLNTMGRFLSRSFLIHGAYKADEDTFSDRRFTLEYKSIKEAENLLYKLSDKFSWCLIPWIDKGISVIAFLSHDRNLFDRFVSIYTKCFQVASSNLRTSIVSQYELCSKHTGFFKALFIDLAFENLGSRIWKSCNCELENPWLITDQSYDLDSEYGVSLVKELSFHVDGDSASKSRLRNLKIFSANNMTDFGKLCSDSLSFSSTTIAVSSKTDTQLIQYLLSKTELYDYDNHDLQWLDFITENFQWFYGIGRDYTDISRSFFFTKNSSLLSAIDSITLEDDYQFISCF